MKKVLVFVPEFPRLTETFIEREISKLIDLGKIEVTVFAIKKASGSMSENVSKVLVYRRLNPFYLVYGLIYFYKNHRKRVDKALALIQGEDSLTYFQRYKYFIKAFGYAIMFRQHHPDQIHSHFLSWPSTVAMVAATLLDIPYSISAHARDVMVDGSLIPTKVRTSTFISICNDYAWKKCIELSGMENPENVYRIYHGVDPSKLDLSNPKMQKPDRPFIFVGSRLVEKKGLPYVIEASKILKERNVNHEIHIVGPGPMYDELMAQIREKGVEDFVFIQGGGKGIPWDEVKEYFKISDIFAHPSINTGWGDADGVPTFVIEAALARLPVVATDAGSITDLIIDQQTGLIVPQKDAYAIADALEKLIFDAELRKTLGNNAHDKAVEMFNIEQNVSALQNLLLS